MLFVLTVQMCVITASHDFHAVHGDAHLLCSCVGRMSSVYQLFNVVTTQQTSSFLLSVHSYFSNLWHVDILKEKREQTLLLLQHILA